MEEVKKISVLSAGKIGALFGLVLGLVMGIFSVVLVKLYPIGAAAILGTGVIELGWKNLWISPLSGVVSYFIVAVIISALYNLFAKYLGGIKIDLKKSKN